MCFSLIVFSVAFMINKPAKLRHCSLYRTCPSSIGNRMCL